MEELRERLQSVRVVATTCQNTNHALLRRLTFDVCIVDEASQVFGASPVSVRARTDYASEDESVSD